MSYPFSAFSLEGQYVKRYRDLRLITNLPGEESFDWGFDFDIAFEQLSLFARNLDTAAPVTKLPVFAVAMFALTEESTRKLKGADQEAKLIFPKIPLGVIGTDHVGYGSFDLWPLRQSTVLQAIKTELESKGLIAVPSKPRLTVRLSKLLVLPYKDQAYAFDALKEGELAPNYICLRMDLDQAMMQNRQVWPSMPSMQTPGILDWRLSPGSFSMSGALLIGEDGCETLLPSNLATKLIRFRQIIKTQKKAVMKVGNEPNTVVLGPSGEIRIGYAVPFNTEWFPLGHSLGQIAYSLPLAPGEKMKISIVDWTRRDAANRTEQTKEKEDLQHAALRDRNLTEAVSMVVNESQSGSSFMAGGALSAGAGIPIGPVSLGIGGAFGAGGASSDSQGMRSVVGNTTQQISDAFHQATSAQRELNSTVVIQSEQTENAQAKTRTVANYNHSHALTILYYEVLQHQRLITRPASAKPVLFIKYNSLVFDYDLMERYADTIASSLLDPSLKTCLDVVRERACLKATLDRRKAKLEKAGDPLDDELLSTLTVSLLSGANVPNVVIVVSVLTKNGTAEIECVIDDPSLWKTNNGTPYPTYLDNGFGTHLHANQEFIVNVHTSVPVRWKNVDAIQVRIQPFGQLSHPPGFNLDWNLNHIRVITVGSAGKWVMVESQSPVVVHFAGSQQFPVTRFTAPINDVDDLLTDEKLCCLRRLANHLNAHRAYYWQSVWLSENDADRARRLEHYQFGSLPLMDLVENTLYDFKEGYAVMPVVSGAEAALAGPFEDKAVAKIPNFTEYIEQIVTVPARGVFAEAKLGHCNASEIIDPLRFWDWQTSPIPDDAPDIAAASTDSRYQDPTKGLAPTAFPQSIVNIATPQALPDPTGLSAASGILSALGPFRDMSEMKELGPYLQTLSNNATQLASQGLKNANTAALINTIRSAKEIPEGKRAELIATLLGDQVNPAPVPTPTPVATEKPNPNPQPKPDPNPQPNPKPNPDPNPNPKPQPTPEPVPPKKVSPKSRKLTINFKYDTGQEMAGIYQVSIRDNNTGIEYIQAPAYDGLRTTLINMDLPSSITSATISVRGSVGRSSSEISSSEGIRAEDWSFTVNTGGTQVANLTKVSGFHVIGKTKDVSFDISKTTENGTDEAHTNSKTVTVTAGGTAGVGITVKLDGATAIQWGDSTTTKSATSETVVTHYTAHCLDIQKQPTIEPIVLP